jgi:mannosyl-3-phosphoglycerate phosphatase
MEERFLMARLPYVVFTDLDGTLLDHATYSFEPARPALGALTAAGVPLVFCTSKTRAETERWRLALENTHPFIVENGGAVFVPEGYFPFEAKFDRTNAGYGILELGKPYAELRRVLAVIRTRTGLDLRGFGDMTLEEIAERCGFPLKDAALAAKREYDEPFVAADPVALPLVVREAEVEGLRVVSGGRFHHLVGASDKGRAVSALLALFTQAQGAVQSVGVGDSLNDEPMLRAVDIPILVRKPRGGRADAIHVPGLVLAPYAGPEGWREAILELLRGVP